MKHSVFTIYDSKVDAFLPPFYMQTKPAAIRAITDTMNDPSHQFAKHPEDYTLFYLGQFDDGTATFDLEKTPISLCLLLELTSQDQNQPKLKYIDGVVQ